MLEQIKILNGILALGEFTARELATFTGVKYSTVNTVLRRRRPLIEDAAVELTGRPGGQTIRFRLKREAVDKLRKEIAEAATAIAVERQQAQIEEVPQSLNLESAEEFLNYRIRKAESTAEKRQLLETADVYLKAANDEFREFFGSSETALAKERGNRLASLSVLRDSIEAEIKLAVVVQLPWLRRIIQRVLSAAQQVPLATPRDWRPRGFVAVPLAASFLLAIGLGPAILYNRITANNYPNTNPLADTGPSDARVEKSQPGFSQAAFLRMRTVGWYDVKWSKTNLTVNEEYEITGKLYIMNSWPAAIEVPAQCFLNTGQPGAMAARLGVWVGGTFTPRSMKLELGKTYAFRVLLKARRPGHWHTQVQLSVKTGGPILGPGQYIDIKGNFSDYKDEVKLLNGTTVDIENYGQAKIYMWHLLWIIAGGAWILYWFGKRGFIGRFAWVASGKGDELITPQERMVGALTLVGVLLVVIIFYAITVSSYPNTIPLQAGDFRNIQALENEVNSGPITIKYVNGTYKVRGRELVANFKITNNGKEPLRIGEFNTAGLRFLNPDVYTEKVVYPDYLLADRGLSLSDNSPIAPGETRDVAVTIQDARWDTERLSDLAYDVDSSFAGVLFFFSPSGARYPMEVGGAVIPTFMPV